MLYYYREQQWNDEEFGIAEFLFDEPSPVSISKCFYSKLAYTIQFSFVFIVVCLCQPS